MSPRLSILAKKIEREVGTSRAASYRIAKKLNTLATRVDWAEPVRNGNEVRRSTTVGRRKLSKRHSRTGGKRRQSRRSSRGRSRSR